MNENEILAEIRRIRDEHARECGYDIHILFERLRAETAQLEAEGWRVVSPDLGETPALLREDPPDSR